MHLSAAPRWHALDLTSSSAYIQVYLAVLPPDAHLFMLISTCIWPALMCPLTTQRFGNGTSFNPNTFHANTFHVQLVTAVTFPLSMSYTPFTTSGRIFSITITAFPHVCMWRHNFMWTYPYITTFKYSWDFLPAFAPAQPLSGTCTAPTRTFSHRNW